MKIGILTYHWVANFGANLQTLSTINNIRNAGYEPIVINWIPDDLKLYYEKYTPEEQIAVHNEFAESFYNVTRVCKNDIDIANVISDENLDGVIIGSDAVFTYIPFIKRFHLNRKTLIKYTKPCIDSDFPSPFWGSFLKYVDVPIVAMSASAQNTDYKSIITPYEKNGFKEAIRKFSYIAVRDVWTKQMIMRLTDNDINPIITPDPVFAFNNNGEIYVKKEEILNKYHLPDKYILISIDKHRIDSNWLNILKELVEAKGIKLVELPRTTRPANLGLENVISFPIPPLDWYYLIKYSNGYIGELMHPIVVSLHNSNPMFAFDTYGFKKRGTLDTDSSKTYQIMNRFGLLSNYYNELLDKELPSPQKVVDAIINFPKEQCMLHANECLNDYKSMMGEIYDIFKNKKKV